MCILFLLNLNYAPLNIFLDILFQYKIVWILDGDDWPSPSSPGKLLHHSHSSLRKQKVLVPLRGTRTEKTISAVPPCLPEKSDRSARCQHTGCPLTLAMRQKILRMNPVLPALSGPFAAPLFAPLSAVRNSLWMRLQLYSRFCGFKLCYALYTPWVQICQALFF